MAKLFNYCRYIIVTFFLLNQIINNVWADSTTQDYDLNELPSLDFDDLMAADIQVSSAMKRLQNASETAASIYVLSHKEIMLSGVSSVAEALKLVPGMQVRKLDNNQWAITSRSVAGRYSSKLLVMIDGQSIYTPGFSGVYWEALNMPLYDIERIEVIRGQGGLLWGSNATNGVVNIITKHSADTRNILAQVETRSQRSNKANFRVGGDLANYSSFRLFGSVEKTGESIKSNEGIVAVDDGKKSSIGGRMDLNLNDDLSLLAQTQYIHIDMGQNLRVPNLVNYQREYVEDQSTRDHFQLMTRLDHRINAESNQVIQASISSQRGDQLYLEDNFFMVDTDYQMNTSIDSVQFDWGVSYRYNTISILDNDYISSLNDIDSYNQFGGFIQAQFTLIPDKLKLILGNKSERNSFTGWEHQPMARALWTPYKAHVLWGAISQGVRVPSWLEYNSSGLLISSSGIRTEFIGNPDLEAEKSISEELGYRYMGKTWSTDISLFYTKARDVIVINPNINDTFTFIAFDFVSDAALKSYGGEAIFKWQPHVTLRTELAYSFTAYEYTLPLGTQVTVDDEPYLRQLSAKAHYSLTADHSLSAIYRIEEGDIYRTDDFSVLDLSWNWQVTPSVALLLSGKNLLYGKHQEYNNTSAIYTVATYIEPRYLARLTVDF